MFWLCLKCCHFFLLFNHNILENKHNFQNLKQSTVTYVTHDWRKYDGKRSMYMHDSAAICLCLRPGLQPDMVAELLWCWLGIGKGISSPNLWRGTREQWDPTQPQVPSGSEPENFPLPDRTTSPRARKSFPWVSTFFLQNPDNEKRKALGGTCVQGVYYERRKREREWNGVWWEERHIKRTGPHLRFLIRCFHWPHPKGLTVLSWEPSSAFSFLLLWQNVDLPLPRSRFPFQITFYSVFYERSDGTFLYPR